MRVLLFVDRIRVSAPITHPININELEFVDREDPRTTGNDKVLLRIIIRGIPIGEQVDEQVHRCLATVGPARRRCNDDFLILDIDLLSRFTTNSFHQIIRRLLTLLIEM